MISRPRRTQRLANIHKIQLPRADLVLGSVEMRIATHVENVLEHAKKTGRTPFSVWKEYTENRTIGINTELGQAWREIKRRIDRGT